MKDAHAIVVLPGGALGRIKDPAHRRWLSRGKVSLRTPEVEMLAGVLDVLQLPVPEEGLAALRFWGQTGERSGSWIAAADPIHLQARMRDLRVRSLSAGELDSIDLAAMFTTLQRELGADGQYSFARLGSFGYLQCAEPLVLPAVSATIADGHVPDKFTPSGESARRFHQLLGEVQMLLHDHDVNRQREDAGLVSINTLWFWGGGIAPPAGEARLPALYGNDPLFAGYWASCGGNINPWTDIATCANALPGAYVAVTPEESPASLGEYLDSLRAQLNTGKLNLLTLLFRDGLTVVLEKYDRCKYWRRVSPHLDAVE